MGRLDLIDDWIALARPAKYSSVTLAKTCFVSVSHLRRHFHRIYGRAPQEWLNELRLWHAMELLCKGMLIKEVASILHFGGASHLCHQFKDYHGCAPSECARIFHERQRKARARGVAEDDIILPWKEAERRLASRFRSSFLINGSFNHGDLSTNTPKAALLHSDASSCSKDFAARPVSSVGNERARQ